MLAVDGEFDHDLQASGPHPGAGDDDPMIGREIIGQYVITAKIGEGGMGEVYLADQPAIGRRVAIKVVHPQARGAELDELATRFRNEAKAVAQLDSPHIVQIFNWGELADGTLFMAMEFLRGQTLAELLRGEGPLAPARAVHIAEQICAALTQAHEAGIVHRDLKPSNVMLVERGDDPCFVKVLDFGVAKLEGSDITRSGAMFGTPQYMSPEQLRADGLDGRSDLYGLGVLIYEMLSGALPFSSPTAVGFITAHLHDEPPMLPRGLPRGLAALVAQLLAKTPEQRPADAATVARELRAALDGRATGARRWARRRALRGPLLGTAVLAGLAVLVLGGWKLWAWRGDTQAALARERAERADLERRLADESAAADEARAQAQTAAAAARAAMARARSERAKPRESSRVDRRRPRGVASSALPRRSHRELEAELRRVLAARRVPPSELADVWRSHEQLLAQLAAETLSEAELEQRLEAWIALYQRDFATRQPGDGLALARLEQLFADMPSALSPAAREQILAATYDEYDGNSELDERDRGYFKRLAVAALIREHADATDPFAQGGASEAPAADTPAAADTSAAADTPAPPSPTSADPQQSQAPDSSSSTPTSLPAATPDASEGDTAPPPPGLHDLNELSDLDELVDGGDEGDGGKASDGAGDGPSDGSKPQL